VQAVEVRVLSWAPAPISKVSDFSRTFAPAPAAQVFIARRQRRLWRDEALMSSSRSPRRDRRGAGSRRSVHSARQDWRQQAPGQPPRDRERIMPILSTGCRWRAIPKDLPSGSTLFDYLDLWTLRGALDRMHHAAFVECHEQDRHRMISWRFWTTKRDLLGRARFPIASPYLTVTVIRTEGWMLHRTRYAPAASNL
jgi:transposase